MLASVARDHLLLEMYIVLVSGLQLREPGAFSGHHALVEGRDLVNDEGARPQIAQQVMGADHPDMIRRRSGQQEEPDERSVPEVEGPSGFGRDPLPYLE